MAGKHSKKIGQAQRIQKKAILDVLKYFALFGYAPTFEQIYISLSIQLSQKVLADTLGGMEKKKNIVTKDIRLEPQESKKFNGYKKITGKKTILYAMRGEGILFKNRAQKWKNTHEKLEKVDRFISLASRASAIKLIGLSGSCTMGNAKKKDDVDLFIISAPGRIWTARIICVVIAAVLGKKRWPNEKVHKDRICLNMFMSLSDLQVASEKQSRYTAHEVVQMSPLVDKEGTYTIFMSKNIWVQNYFPNYAGTGMGIVKKLVNIGRNRKNLMNKTSFLGDVCEPIFKHLQLLYMKRRRSKEYISDTQLWFFPKDYYDKLKHHLE